MKNLRWQIVIAGTALVAIAVLLITQRQDPESGSVQPTAGGIYSEGLIGQPSRLNPLLDAYNQVDQDVNRLLFSSLIKFDSRGLPQPDLAETWGVSVNGMVYNFTLKSNAVWHDLEPVTAGDVLFTITLMRDADMPVGEDLRELWNTIEVEVFDDQNIQFRLPEPFAPFLDYLSFGILPSHLLENLSAEEIINAEFNLEPVGSGPYRFGQVLTEDDEIRGVVLRSFDEYYSDSALIDQVVFRYYDSQEEALEGYRQGEIDGLSQVSGNVLAQALAEPDLNVYSVRLPQLSLVLLNLENPETPFFQEVEVRKALLAGLNREWIAGRLLGGQAVLADGPILPGTWAYYDDIERVAFNPNEAVTDLKAAGYFIPSEGGDARAREGELLSFELVHPDDDIHASIAQAIQADWVNIGVRVNLVAVDYATLINDYLEPGNYQAALIDLDLTGLPDPDPYPFWHQSQAAGGQNYSRWNDRRASEYLERARVSVLLDTRIRLYRNFQAHFSRELPALLLFYPIYNYAVDAKVQGVQLGPIFNPADRFLGITSWALILAAPVEEILPTDSP